MVSMNSSRVRATDGRSRLRAPNAPFENMSFVPVGESKSTKNRVHIDIVTPDVEALVEAGATLLRSRDNEIDWDVLADPEGNEFYALADH